MLKEKQKPAKDLIGKHKELLDELFDLSDKIGGEFSWNSGNFSFSENSKNDYEIPEFLKKNESKEIKTKENLSGLPFVDKPITKEQTENRNKLYTDIFLKKWGNDITQLFIKRNNFENILKKNNLEDMFKKKKFGELIKKLCK